MTAEFLCLLKFPGHDSGTPAPQVRILTGQKIAYFTGQGVSVENTGRVVRLGRHKRTSATDQAHTIMALADDPTFVIRVYRCGTIERGHGITAEETHPYPDWYRQAMKEWLS